MMMRCNNSKALVQLLDHDSKIMNESGWAVPHNSSAVLFKKEDSIFLRSLNFIIQNDPYIKARFGEGVLASLDDLPAIYELVTSKGEIDLTLPPAMRKLVASQRDVDFKYQEEIQEKVKTTNPLFESAYNALARDKKYLKVVKRDGFTNNLEFNGDFRGKENPKISVDNLALIYCDNYFTKPHKLNELYVVDPTLPGPGYFFQRDNLRMVFWTRPVKDNL